VHRCRISVTRWRDWGRDAAPARSHAAVGGHASRKSRRPRAGPGTRGPTSETARRCSGRSPDSSACGPSPGCAFVSSPPSSLQRTGSMRPFKMPMLMPSRRAMSAAQGVASTQRQPVRAPRPRCRLHDTVDLAAPSRRHQLAELAAQRDLLKVPKLSPIAPGTAPPRDHRVARLADAAGDDHRRVWIAACGSVSGSTRWRPRRPRPHRGRPPPSRRHGRRRSAPAHLGMRGRRLGGGVMAAWPGAADHGHRSRIGERRCRCAAGPAGCSLTSGEFIEGHHRCFFVAAPNRRRPA